MPSSYPFPIYSGILSPKHYKQIGNAIWLFLWCISSTTKEVERDGVTWGIVLGNKPMKLKEFADIFEVNEKTVRRWLNDLEKYEYIKITRVPYGLIISVRKSKKFKNERVDKNVHSETDWTKMSIPEWTEVSTLPDKNVHSNKDIIKINNNTNTTTTNTTDPIDLVAEKYSDLKTIQDGKPCYPTSNDYQVIAQIIAQGVPSSRIIELLEIGFKDFHERKPNGKIKSFSYFKDFIMEQHEAIEAKSQAKTVVERGVPQNGAKIHEYRRRNGRPTTKSAEQVLREAEAARKAWGG